MREKGGAAFCLALSILTLNRGLVAFWAVDKTMEEDKLRKKGAAFSFQSPLPIFKGGI